MIEKFRWGLVPGKRRASWVLMRLMSKSRPSSSASSRVLEDWIRSSGYPRHEHISVEDKTSLAIGASILLRVGEVAGYNLRVVALYEASTAEISFDF